MGMELEGVGELLRFIPEFGGGSGMYSVRFYSVFAFFLGGGRMG